MPPAHENLTTEEQKSCQTLHEALYWQAGEPSASQLIKKEVWIKPETGLPPEYGEEAEGLLLENHTLYQDPVTDLYCADCVRPVDEEGQIQYEKHLVKYEVRQ